MFKSNYYTICRTKVRVAAAQLTQAGTNKSNHTPLPAFSPCARSAMYKSFATAKIPCVNPPVWWS